MKQKMARWLLQTLGWSLDGEPPGETHFVLIAAPHTSNWDFPLMMLFAAAFGVKINWLAKDTLFRPGMGWLMHALGGVPVVRSKSRNMVDTMVEAFESNKQLILAVPTEGTRTLTEHWKSGFYHIACGAKVPIVPSFLNYGEKRGGFGLPIIPTGDLRADMDYFRQFYSGMRGRFPGQFGPIRLKEEDSID